MYNPDQSPWPPPREPARDPGENEATERALRFWRAHADDDTALTDEELDEALVMLLEAIHHTL